MALSLSLLASLVSLLLLAEGENQSYGGGLHPRDIKKISDLSSNPESAAFAKERNKTFLTTLVQSNESGRISQLPLTLDTDEAVQGEGRENGKKSLSGRRSNEATNGAFGDIENNKDNQGVNDGGKKTRNRRNVGGTGPGMDGYSKDDGTSGERGRRRPAPSDQQKLYNDLFRNYNKHIRPVIHHEEVIKVQFEIALFNVLSLDTKNGVMITNTEVITKWYDPYLQWDPDDYNQTTSLLVMYDDVWHPDIILFNTADTNYESAIIHTNIIVEHSGLCKLATHALFTSVCNVAIEWFPFDQQTCDMIFASWTSDISKMVLVEGPSDITRYNPNQEFFMENFYSESFEDFNPCCEHPFSMISYHIQLQRRTKFAVFFFIVPGVLINMCALLVFTLPAESGEKIGLGINSMLAMIVFLMAMTEKLPPTQNLPLAGIYYGVCMAVVTINIAFSVYVLNLSYSGDRGYEVPVWMRITTLFVAKVTFMKVPTFIEELWDLDENRKIMKDKVRVFADQFNLPHNHEVINVIPHYNVKTSFSDSIKDPIQRRKVEALEGMLALMTQQSRKATHTQKVSELAEQWKYLSRVLDRLLFILFGITTFLFNLILLTQSPYSEEFEYCPMGPDMCGEDYDFDNADVGAHLAIPECLRMGDLIGIGEGLVSSNDTSPEHRLFIDLFSTYNKHIRPIKKHGEITQVFFELSLFDVLMLDTKNQYVRTNTEIIMKWMDSYLSWDPAEYEDTRVIRVPYKDIWYPDIILMNTGDAEYDSSILNTNAIVFHTGEVELLSHGIFNSICSLDVQYYPFDQQLCQLTFSSWTYDNEQIILLPGPADLSKFVQNPMFFLENFYREYKEVHNPCCKNPMSTIVFYIQLQRRTIFSLFFFIMPGILINICALMVFSIPSESGEKVGLGINSMLAMMVFLMAMTEKLPPTEKIPLAGVYYGTCITMIALNITFSVSVLNLNVMGMRGYKVPETVKIITLIVAKVFVVKIPTIVRESWRLDEREDNPNLTKVEPFEEVTDANGGLIKVFSVEHASPRAPEKPSQVMEDFEYSILKDPFQKRALMALDSMCLTLMKNRQATEMSENTNKLIEQWKFISRVMDRTLFVTFSLACLLFNIAILTSSPFREKFDYCPLEEGMCDDMTFEEIKEITLLSASNVHFDGHGGVEH
ncbi:uncharacterized protein [Palaemon carinicauda]|uniref:uncharacterized protein n=1 Tax=Palaemon carinicauda TaxID=392227 RepID=UPI0035B6AB39